MADGEIKITYCQDIDRAECEIVIKYCQYIDRPWNDAHMMATNRDYCLIEKALFRNHCYTISHWVDWKRRYAAGQTPYAPSGFPVCGCDDNFDNEGPCVIID